MNGIIEFLRARYDEAEQAASAASGETWTIDHSCGGSGDACWCCVITADHMRIYDEGGHDYTQARHIVMHDPASVLRDIAAKRAILAQCESLSEAPPGTPGIDIVRVELGTVLLALSLQFADHPDYREEWKP